MILNYRIILPEKNTSIAKISEGIVDKLDLNNVQKVPMNKKNVLNHYHLQKRPTIKPFI